MEVTSSSSQVERVTAESHKAKDLKKVEAGRAGFAARKAKQERRLEDLRGAKESLQRSETASFAESERSEDVVRAQKTMLYKKKLSGSRGFWEHLVFFIKKFRLSILQHS